MDLHYPFPTPLRSCLHCFHESVTVTCGHRSGRPPTNNNDVGKIENAFQENIRKSQSVCRPDMGIPFSITKNVLQE